MAEAPGDDGLTTAGRAAHRARAQKLAGSRQARADLAARWAATQRDDPSAPSVPLIQPTQQN